jgi:prepilin-type N-terminal cleavage/methylation domain-containing protein
MNMHLPMSSSRRPKTPGMTLVETLMALSILAVVSTAVAAMLHAGARVSNAMNASITSQWEVQSALLNITQQVRLCASVTVPNGTGGGTSFSLVSQPDSANNNTSYTISYALATVDGVQVLQQTDPRFDTKTLIHNVQSFDVRTKNTGSPQILILTLTTAGTPPVTRTVRITPRNQ